ncbi:MAG TPA: hypothetical protein VGJ00_07005 [Rhabdochlamydiaceae bacterium]|jgi:hypothetical protein
MVDFDKKIQQPPEHDPYENISINPIEKNKKDKEEFLKHQRTFSRPQIFATLLSFFKKFISLLGFKDRSEALFFDYQLMLEHLAALRIQLQILARLDESHNSIFIQQLTELWHNLMDDCNSIPTSLEISSQSINNIKFFISQIAQYPHNADHTLKYYFDAYAGKDWTPFPFMEMLKGLHEEYQSHRAGSHLEKWLFLIDSILAEENI